MPKELPPKPPPEGKAAVSVREAAWILDGSIRWVRWLIYTKQVRGWQVQGNKWRIPVEDIEAFKAGLAPEPQFKRA